MIHVDAYYLSLAVLGAALLAWGSFLLRKATNRTGIMAATLLIGFAGVVLFFTGRWQGSVYHPCKVESFETMAMRCE
jgi:hypothetical protein